MSTIEEFDQAVASYKAAIVDRDEKASADTAAREAAQSASDAFEQSKLNLANEKSTLLSVIEQLDLSS